MSKHRAYDSIITTMILLLLIMVSFISGFYVSETIFTKQTQTITTPKIQVVPKFNKGQNFNNHGQITA